VELFVHLLKTAAPPGLGSLYMHMHAERHQLHLPSLRVS